MRLLAFVLLISYILMT